MRGCSISERLGSGWGVASGAHSSSSTKRRQTPAWMTSWILSLVPSDRYDSAQHASVSTSSSCEWISRASVGSASFVCRVHGKVRS